MNKINLYGNFKTPSNYTTKSNNVIYQCNTGDCGQVCLCSNNLSSLYDVNLSTPLTNSYLYWSGTNLGYTNRLLTFSQTNRLIFNDTGPISTTLGSSPTVLLKPLTLVASSPIIYSNYQRVFIGQTLYGIMNTTRFNSNAVIGLQANTTSPANNPPLSTTTLNSVLATGTSSLITSSSTTGIYTIPSTGVFSVSYLYSLDLTINATFDNGSYFLVQLTGNLSSGGTSIIGTQSYFLSNQMRGFNIIFNRTFTTFVGLATVRATIQYLGGNNLTPFSGITLTNNNYCMTASLTQF